MTNKIIMLLNKDFFKLTHTRRCHTNIYSSVKELMGVQIVDNSLDISEYNKLQYLCITT